MARGIGRIVLSDRYENVRDFYWRNESNGCCFSGSIRDKDTRRRLLRSVRCFVNTERKRCVREETEELDGERLAFLAEKTKRLEAELSEENYPVRDLLLFD